MRSMTGFGTGEAALGAGRVVLELRALNHRFLDLRVRVPPELAEQSFFLEQALRERLNRGRFDLGVRVDGAALPAPELDLVRARAAYASLERLRDELAPGTELPLSALLLAPHLVTVKKELDAGAVQATLTAALGAAVVSLNAMREQEGLSLARELRGRVDAMREVLRELSARRDELIGAYRVRLRERLMRLLADTGAKLEAGRLEAEVAIMADRSDVTEELVRLESHLDQFARLLDADEPIGRRLDFLLQEVGREINTIGSKSPDSALSLLVVELKAQAERMREQVQNVE